MTYALENGDAHVGRRRDGPAAAVPDQSDRAWRPAAWHLGSHVPDQSDRAWWPAAWRVGSHVPDQSDCAWWTTAKRMAADVPDQSDRARRPAARDLEPGLSDAADRARWTTAQRDHGVGTWARLVSRPDRQRTADGRAEKINAEPLPPLGKFGGRAAAGRSHAFRDRPTFRCARAARIVGRRAARAARRKKIWRRRGAAAPAGAALGRPARAHI